MHVRVNAEKVIEMALVACLKVCHCQYTKSIHTHFLCCTNTFLIYTYLCRDPHLACILTGTHKSSHSPHQNSQHWEDNCAHQVNTHLQIPLSEDIQREG